MVRVGLMLSEVSGFLSQVDFSTDLLAERVSSHKLWSPTLCWVLFGSVQGDRLNKLRRRIWPCTDNSTVSFNIANSGGSKRNFQLVDIKCFLSSRRMQGFPSDMQRDMSACRNLRSYMMRLLWPVSPYNLTDSEGHYVFTMK